MGRGWWYWQEMKAEREAEGARTGTWSGGQWAITKEFETGVR